MKSLTLYALLFASCLASCKDRETDYDAAGVFEAKETIISAEASGKIIAFKAEEGDLLKPNEYLGYVDTTSLSLKKRQLQAQINALLSRKPDIATQIASLQQQLQTAKREQERVSNLVKAGAATPKQLDDINAQVDVLKKQIAAQMSSLSTSSESISQEAIPLQVQIEQVNEQIDNSLIINPTQGTVLTTYVEENEFAAPGKPLYRIADLSSIILRAYITGDQLPAVKPGQQVTVLVDSGKQEYKSYPGKITWISEKAEFTPKTIQTRDERANLVYAIKILVKNEGFLKTGMYAEVKF